MLPINRYLLLVALLAGLGGCAYPPDAATAVDWLKEPDVRTRRNAATFLTRVRAPLPEAVVVAVVASLASEADEDTLGDLIEALGKTSSPLAGPAIGRLVNRPDVGHHARYFLRRWLAGKGVNVDPAGVRITKEASEVRGCTFRGNSSARVRNLSSVSKDAVEAVADTAVVTELSGRVSAELYACNPVVKSALGSTTVTPAAPPLGPTPSATAVPEPVAAAPAATAGGAAPRGGDDIVRLVGGGRLVGIVVADEPTGVTIRLADGSVRKLKRAQVGSIDYATK